MKECTKLCIKDGRESYESMPTLHSPIVPVNNINLSLEIKLVMTNIVV